MSNEIESPPEYREPQPEGSGRKWFWTNSFVWGALLTLAWKIYEATSNRSLGIVVLCTKFGWDDLLTGWWILRRDPDSGRGRTCFMFYLASSIWRTTVAAFLMCGGILTLQVLLNQRAGDLLKGVGTTALIGVSLLAIVPLFALISARITGTRVWIDNAAHDSRRSNAWPPASSQVNFVANLLFPALLLPIPLTAVVSFRLGALPMLVLMFGEGLLMWSLFRRVAASTPEECWGSEDARQDFEDEDVEVGEIEDYEEERADARDKHWNPVSDYGQRN